MSYDWRDFSVGDRIRFREWDDMAEEFGSHDGEIYCKFLFIRSMLHLCGTTATISSMHSRSGEITLCDFEIDGDTRFKFSVDMIEPANSVIPCDFDEGQFLSMLD